MGKKRAIRLFLDRTFEEKNYSSDVNKLNYERDKTVNFEPACVFSEKKPRHVFWRGARNIILFVDGCRNALKFSEVTDLMSPFWTQKEAAEFVKKMIAKSLEKHKPMKWSQVIFLMIPLVIIIIVLLAIAKRVGVF